jgi:hypothetical protein
MTTPREGNLLLSALLERIGYTQAQAFLTRLDQWLSPGDRNAPPQIVGERRKKEANTGIHNFAMETASRTPKDS